MLLGLTGRGTAAIIVGRELRRISHFSCMRSKKWYQSPSGARHQHLLCIPTFLSQCDLMPKSPKKATLPSPTTKHCSRGYSPRRVVHLFSQGDLVDRDRSIRPIIRENSGQHVHIRQDGLTKLVSKLQCKKASLHNLAVTAERRAKGATAASPVTARNIYVDSLACAKLPCW